MKRAPIAVIFMTGLMLSSSALGVTFQEIARFDVASSGNIANPEYIGNNPSAVAWNGRQLYIAGFNASGATNPAGIVEITNAASTGLVTATYARQHRRAGHGRLRHPLGRLRPGADGPRRPDRIPPSSTGAPPSWSWAAPGAGSWAESAGGTFAGRLAAGWYLDGGSTLIDDDNLPDRGVQRRPGPGPLLPWTRPAHGLARRALHRHHLARRRNLDRPATGGDLRGGALRPRGAGGVRLAGLAWRDRGRAHACRTGPPRAAGDRDLEARLKGGQALARTAAVTGRRGAASASRRRRWRP